MAAWTEILDHGDDPARYTLIDGKGRVITANENGSIVSVRQCKNPYKLVADLCREPSIKIVKPAKQVELLQKINRFLLAKLNGN
ncbi:hypothetical protein [Spirosoma aerophilum]